MKNNHSEEGYININGYAKKNRNQGGLYVNITRNTAFRRPWGFCDQGCIMDDVLCARANRSWFHRIFSLFNP